VIKYYNENGAMLPSSIHFLSEEVSQFSRLTFLEKKLCGGLLFSLTFVQKEHNALDNLRLN